MIAGALGVALGVVVAAAVDPPVGRLPARAERRYRVEIGGEPVGWASLSISCPGPGDEARCASTWTSALRAPADAGGGTMERRIGLETGPDGRALRVRTWQRDGRGERAGSAGSGEVPASLAETLLAAVPGAARRCRVVQEETSGRTGTACATPDREAGWFTAEVLGAAERFRAAPGEPPDEVLLPGQRTRFVADPDAALPARAPRLFGVGVPGPAPEAARRFCGRGPERKPARGAGPGGLPAGLPPADAPGASCREKTARWLAAAARAGLPGRHVVGVAHDGTSFVWHEWAEVRAGGRWVAIDPSFRQAPAAGPRFAVARFREGDAAAEAAAGAAVLACWGNAAVEGR